MTNRNHKYQNGLVKREAVRLARAELLARGAFVPERPADTLARLGYRPHVILDTNVSFALTEYWAGPLLRRSLRELMSAQAALRLYLLDVVSTELRGQAGKRERYAETVFDGSNAEQAVIYPLPSSTNAIAALFTPLADDVARRRARSGALVRPSDRKDALIAAAAVAYDMTVVTANVADFVPFRALLPSLRLISLDAPDHEKRMGALLLEELGALFVR